MGIKREMIFHDYIFKMTWFHSLFECKKIAGKNEPSGPSARVSQAYRGHLNLLVGPIGLNPGKGGDNRMLNWLLGPCIGAQPRWRWPTFV